MNARLEPLDTPEALRLLHDAVLERGYDYVYVAPGGSCLYVHTEVDGEVVDGTDPDPDEHEHLDPVLTPGCLVGLALHRHGLPLEVMEPLNISEADVLLIEHASIQDYVRSTPEARRVMREAQMHQDNERSWGVALGEAYVTALGLPDRVEDTQGDEDV